MKKNNDRRRKSRNSHLHNTLSTSFHLHVWDLVVLLKHNSQNQTIIFRSLKDTSKTLLEGMKRVQEEMKSKGLLNDNTTFEEMAKYAGQHILITESES